MTQTARLFLLVPAFCLVAALDALAQGPPPLRMGFANINGGGQARSQSFDESGRFDIYEERATFGGSQKIGGGGLFDISGGYRVWRNLYVGLGVTTFSSDNDITVTASVPDPLVFDRPRSTSTSVAGLTHKETGVHFQATWMVPVTTKFDVAFSLGPSFFQVSQDLVTGITIAEGASNTANITAVNVSEEKESGGGFNFGVDGTYLIARPIRGVAVGGGVFLRYAGGSIDFTRADGSKLDLDTGGFQIGFGARVRF